MTRQLVKAWQCVWWHAPGEGGMQRGLQVRTVGGAYVSGVKDDVGRRRRGRGAFGPWGD